MASDHLVTTATVEPIEDTMFGVPIYAVRKPKRHKTRNLVLGGAGVALVALLGAGLVLSERGPDAVANAGTASSAPLAVPVQQAVPLPRTDVVLPPQMAAIPPARTASRPVRVTPRAAPLVETARAPSANDVAADVSTTVPDVAPIPPATPAQAATGLPPTPVPAEIMPVE